jgi:hypothetical protein
MLPSHSVSPRIAKGSIAPKQRSRRGLWASSLDDWSAGDEAIDDHDYGDHEQEMDQPSTHVHDEEPKDPKDEENYRDGPKHDGILARSELRVAPQESPRLGTHPIVGCALC